MMIGGTNFTLGSDPELFLKDRKSGRFVGAYGVTSGTKRRPEKALGNASLQVDGMALEINTNAYRTALGFTRGVGEVLSNLPGILSNRGFGDLSIEATPTVDFDQEEWDRAPEESKILGCSPDFNAWSGTVNEVPDASVPFRSGAGHIHVGWGRGIKQSEDFKMVCAEFTKEMDVVLGVASLLWDQDTRRRELYGKAGAFRPKSYGVEYRTLSNAWLRSDKLIGYVAEMTFLVVSNLMGGHRYADEEVETIINTNDVEDAKAFLIFWDFKLPPERVV